MVASSFAIAGGCFAGLDIRAVFAQARMEGKPLLTAESLGGMMRGAHRGEFNSAIAREALRDLAGFLGRHFYLTDAQIREIRSIPADQLAAFSRMVAANEARGGSVQASFGKLFSGRGDTRLNLSVIQRSAGITIQIQTVGL